MQNDKFRRKYNIVCATDDNYVPLCGIMLTSLFESNPDCYFSIYVLTQGLNNENSILLTSLLDNHKNRHGEINICKPDISAIEQIPVKFHNYINIITFLRFMIPDILPKDVNRVLYLDVDILVRGNISELYEMDLTDMALAACPEHDGILGDLQPLSVAGLIEYLGYPKDAGYFNAGVLLINLDYWRKHDISKKLIEYLTDNYQKCYFFDQDVLNAVLHDSKIFLPCKYNLLISHLSKSSSAKLLRESPVIVHYCSLKPWDSCVLNYPFKKEWEYCRRISPWNKWRSSVSKLEKLKRLLINFKFILQGKRRYYTDSLVKQWEKSL